jgi:ankyrin repeat protein
MRNPNPMTTAHLGAFTLLIFLIAGSLTSCWRQPIDQSALDHEFLDAVVNRNAETVRQLLEKGADVEAKDHNGNTALLRAATRQDQEAPGVVKALLEKRVNLEARDQNGSTPLIVAAEIDRTAVVRLLIDKGADVEAKDQNGETALVHAARGNFFDTVAVLLEKVSDGKEKNQALFATIERGLPIDITGQWKGEGMPRLMPNAAKTVALLLEKGASIEARREDGATPLIDAASHGAADAVKLLLEKGARIEAADDNGDTALIAGACSCAIIDMPNTFGSMQLLLQRGANVEAKNKEGRTALMEAASSGRSETVKLLLDNGAHVSDKDIHGNTALAVAKKNGYDDSAKLLRKARSFQSKGTGKNLND